MEPEPITTIPLGTIVGLAVGLLGIGLAVGWVAAHSRWQRHRARAGNPKTIDLQSVLNVLPFAVLISDAEGNIMAHNTHAAQFLDAFGRGDTVPLTVDAAVGRVIRSQVAESLEMLRPGNKQQVQVSIMPLAEGKTAVSHALILFNNPANGPHQYQVYQQLISAIGHELRTPLTAIMGHTDIMSSCRIEDVQLWKRSLTFVTTEAERLTRLVEDLLHLSRLDLAPPHRKPTNLRLVAEEALSTLFDKAQEQNVSLILQTAGDLPRVLADSDRIRQVFLNLIDNAIKYAPDSKVTIQITPEDDAVQVDVRDTGPGIPLDELALIFDPFYRGSRDKSASGTGLGLTIVKSILEQHNAPIHVESEEGKGTCFAFSLPLVN